MMFLTWLERVEAVVEAVAVHGILIECRVESTPPSMHLILRVQRAVLPVIYRLETRVTQRHVFTHLYTKTDVTCAKYAVAKIGGYGDWSSRLTGANKKNHGSYRGKEENEGHPAHHDGIDTGPSEQALIISLTPDRGLTGRTVWLGVKAVITIVIITAATADSRIKTSSTLFVLRMLLQHISRLRSRELKIDGYELRRQCDVICYGQVNSIKWNRRGVGYDKVSAYPSHLLQTCRTIAYRTGLILCIAMVADNSNAAFAADSTVLEADAA